MQTNTQTVEDWVNDIEDVATPNPSPDSNRYYARKIFREPFLEDDTLDYGRHDNLYQRSFLYRIEHHKKDNGNHRTEIQGLTNLVNSSGFDPYKEPSFQSFLEKDPDLLSYCLFFSSCAGAIDPAQNPGKLAWKRLFEYYRQNKQEKYGVLATSFFAEADPNPKSTFIRYAGLFLLGVLITGLSCGAVPAIPFTESISYSRDIKNAERYLGMRK